MIKNNCTFNYKFDPQQAYNFTPYISELSGISIYYGIGPCNTTGDTNFKVKLNAEHPNLLYKYIDGWDLDINENNKKYDLILDLCPYTCDLLNNKFNTTKYIPIFFPLADNIFKQKERIYPVLYTGHKLDGLPVLDIIYSALYKYLGEDNHKYIQKYISSNSVSGYYSKLDIYSQTKIALIHNVVSYALTPNLTSYKDDPLYVKHLPWHSNSDIYAPQLKSRLFEAAMMGCIPLVYKDNYKIVERYFVENEEFIYFTDKDDLMNKIELILNNYEKYKVIGENAQKKYNEKYTFKHFIDIIKTEYEKRK